MKRKDQPHEIQPIVHRVFFYDKDCPENEKISFWTLGAKRLVGDDAEIEDRKVFHLVHRKGEYPKIPLLQHMKDMNFTANDYSLWGRCGHNLLTIGIEYGEKEVLEQVLNERPELIDMSTASYCTPLLWTIKSCKNSDDETKCLEMIKFLVERGSNVDYYSRDKYNALEYSYQFGLKKIFVYLLKRSDYKYHWVFGFWAVKQIGLRHHLPKDVVCYIVECLFMSECRK